MSVLNTKMLSTLIARNMTRTYNRLGVSTDRISSGMRINSAADDTSYITVRELLRSDVSVLHQGMRNANDAISLVQTAEAALQVIDEKLIRMRELAEQAATGTYSSTQRLIINNEFQAMASEVNRIANATDFNGIKLLDGTLSALTNSIGADAFGQLRIHYGLGNSANEDYINLGVGVATTKGLGLNYPTPRPLLSDILTSGAPEQTFTSGNISFAIISAGSKDVRVHIDDLGIDDTIQVFTTSGRHVAGTVPNPANAFDSLITAQNGFNAGAAYDGSGLNGIPGGGDLPFNVGGADPYTGLNQFNYNGTDVQYSGNGNPGDQNEYLRLDDVKEDLVLFVVGGGQFQIGASWTGEMPPAQVSDTPISIETEENAANALEKIQDAIKIKDNIRTGLAAIQNRMEVTIDQNTRVRDEFQISESAISDTDVPATMTRFATSQIGAQIATAMLAQANVLPQRALELLR